MKGKLVTSLVLASLFVEIFSFAAFGQPIKLAERTPVKLRLLTELVSGKAKVGEAVPLEVREEIKGASGEILVAFGAKATGKVTVSKKRGILGRQGKLEFTIESMEAVDGTRVPLRANIENSGKSNKGAVIASALVLTVLAVFVHGRDITLKEGTELVAYVDRDTMINPPKTDSAAVTTSANTTPAITSTAPPIPTAEFKVLSSFAGNTGVFGELQNDGPDPAGADIIVFIRLEGKIVGAGKGTLRLVEVGTKKAFDVPIEGSTKGDISVEVNPKAVPVSVPATATVPTETDKSP